MEGKYQKSELKFNANISFCFIETSFNALKIVLFYAVSIILFKMKLLEIRIC